MGARNTAYVGGFGDTRHLCRPGSALRSRRLAEPLGPWGVCRPDDPLQLHPCLIVLQRAVEGLHVGGKSALD